MSKPNWNDLTLVRTMPDGKDRVRVDVSMNNELAKHISELSKKAAHNNFAEFARAAFAFYAENGVPGDVKP
jgi:hypothetical protein